MAYVVRPKREKVTAVIASEITTIKAAAKKFGVPERTLRHWREDPELAELAAKTREDMAEGALALAQATMSEIRRRLPEFEPRDLAILFGVLIDKGQLLNGEATSRSEHRELLNGFD